MKRMFVLVVAVLLLISALPALADATKTVHPEDITLTIEHLPPYGVNKAAYLTGYVKLNSGDALPSGYYLRVYLQTEPGGELWPKPTYANPITTLNPSTGYFECPVVTGGVDYMAIAYMIELCSLKDEVITGFDITRGDFAELKYDIFINSYPVWGNLSGRISGEVTGFTDNNPKDYYLIVSIKDELGNLYKKPYLNAYKTAIAENGSYTCLIETNPNDGKATKGYVIALFNKSDDACVFTKSFDQP